MDEQTRGSGGGSTRRSSGGGDHAGYPPTVQRLLEGLSRLPGIGRRSAERLAFHILKADTDEALALADALRDVKTRVRHCSICFNFADEGEPGADAGRDAQGSGATCAVCGSGRRDRSTVMVVEQPRDLIAIEQTGMYDGLYHVLLGRISPLDGVGPDELTIDALLRRVDEPSANAGGERVGEVILALNPTLEGDGTALYLAGELERREGLRLTRLARGLPSGRDIELASKAVLADAIAGRRGV